MTSGTNSAPGGTRVRTRLPATLAVSVGGKTSGEEYETKSEVRRPGYVSDTPNPGFVRVGGGVTLNMGNYNSARVDVVIELPIGASPEVQAQADATYRTASEMVERLLQREIDMVTNPQGQDTQDDNGTSSGSPF